MNPRINFILVSLSIALTGCVSESDNLRSQLNVAEQKLHAQEEEVAKLKDKVNPQDTFDQAWSWVKDHSAQAWHSETATDARTRLIRCWTDLRNSPSHQP